VTVGASDWSTGRLDEASGRAVRVRASRIADAVVIGSRIIEEIEKSTPEDNYASACAKVKALVSGIRQGMDAPVQGRTR